MSRGSQLNIFFQPPVTFSLWRPDYLPKILYASSRRLCSSHSVTPSAT